MTTALQKVLHAAIPICGFAIIFLCTSVGGCYEYVYFQSYIKAFRCDYTAVTLYQQYGTGELLIGIDETDTNLYWVESTGNDRSIYEVLCATYGDTYYNTELQNFPGTSTDPTVFLPNFVSITITSDTDFDEGHPAGTPLDDIIEAELYDTYGYIQSGYTLYNYEPSLYPVTKLLSEITWEDLLLQEGPITLNFTVSPTEPGTHRLTATVTDENSVTYTSTLDYTFDYTPY